MRYDDNWKNCSAVNFLDLSRPPDSLPKAFDGFADELPVAGDTGVDPRVFCLATPPSIADDSSQFPDFITSIFRDAHERTS